MIYQGSGAMKNIFILWREVLIFSAFQLLKFIAAAAETCQITFQEGTKV